MEQHVVDPKPTQETWELFIIFYFLNQENRITVAFINIKKSPQNGERLVYFSNWFWIIVTAYFLLVLCKVFGLTPATLCKLYEILR